MGCEPVYHGSCGFETGWLTLSGFSLGLLSFLPGHSLQDRAGAPVGQASTCWMLARTMGSRSLGSVTFCGAPSQPTGDPHGVDELSCRLEGAHVGGFTSGFQLSAHKTWGPHSGQRTEGRCRRSAGVGTHSPCVKSSYCPHAGKRNRLFENGEVFPDSASGPPTPDSEAANTERGGPAGPWAGLSVLTVSDIRNSEGEKSGGGSGSSPCQALQPSWEGLLAEAEAEAFPQAA